MQTIAKALLIGGDVPLAARLREKLAVEVIHAATFQDALATLRAAGVDIAFVHAPSGVADADAARRVHDEAPELPVLPVSDRDDGLERAVALAIENAALRRSRDEMLAIISHDLRNPLGVVSLSVAAMRKSESGPLGGRRLDPTEKIRRAADQMNALIRDMLDMGRIEAGTLALDLAPHATLPLLCEVFEATRPLADEKPLKLVTEVTGVLPPIVIDRPRAVQVLSTLIEGAIQFTPAGGVVKIGAQVEGGTVKLWVSDGAPEIAEDERARLFERSWRAKRPGQRASGLTLPVTKGIVDAHGGCMWTTSNAGVGTTFCVTFPSS